MRCSHKGHQHTSECQTVSPQRVYFPMEELKRKMSLCLCLQPSKFRVGIHILSFISQKKKKFPAFIAALDKAKLSRSIFQSFCQCLWTWNPPWGFQSPPAAVIPRELRNLSEGLKNIAAVGIHTRNRCCLNSFAFSRYRSKNTDRQLG